MFYWETGIPYSKALVVKKFGEFVCIKRLVENFGKSMIPLIYLMHTDPGRSGSVRQWLWYKVIRGNHQYPGNLSCSDEFSFM